MSRTIEITCEGGTRNQPCPTRPIRASTHYAAQQSATRLGWTHLFVGAHVLDLCPDTAAHLAAKVTAGHHEWGPP